MSIAFRRHSVYALKGARRRAQKGQSLVIGLGLLAFLCFVGYYLLFLSNTARQRIRLNTIADNAAYSAAVAQARLLNYLSFLNRAYVAHHVASAHLHTLASWTDFAYTQRQQSQRRNPPASLIGGFFGPQYGLAYSQSTQVAALGSQAVARRSLYEAAAQHAQFTNQHFPRVQQAVLRALQTYPVSVAQAVLNHSVDPQEIDHYQLEVTFNSLTEDNVAWVPKAGWAADWIRATTQEYQFLKPRNQTVHSLLPVSHRCPHLRHQLRRRGETTLDNSSGWASADTLSFHALRSNRWIGCYYREYSQGWAWVTDTQRFQHIDNPVDAPPDDFADQDFWRWVEEATQWNLLADHANPLAASYARRQKQQLPSSLLQPMLSLKNTEPSWQSSVSLIQRTSQLAIQTQATGEAFFWPPHHQRQQASLVNPYWQARLVTGAFSRSRP